jgi:hypothetical protein
VQPRHVVTIVYKLSFVVLAYVDGRCLDVLTKACSERYSVDVCLGTFRSFAIPPLGIKVLRMRPVTL